MGISHSKSSPLKRVKNKIAIKIATLSRLTPHSPARSSPPPISPTSCPTHSPKHSSDSSPLSPSARDDSPTRPVIAQDVLKDVANPARRANITRCFTVDQADLDGVQKPSWAQGVTETARRFHQYDEEYVEDEYSKDERYSEEYAEDEESVEGEIDDLSVHEPQEFRRECEAFCIQAYSRAVGASEYSKDAAGSTTVQKTHNWAQGVTETTRRSHQYDEEYAEAELDELSVDERQRLRDNIPAPRSALRIYEYGKKHIRSYQGTRFIEKTLQALAQGRTRQSRM